MKKSLLIVALAAAGVTAVMERPVSACPLSIDAQATASGSVNSVGDSGWVNAQYGDRGDRRGEGGGPEAVLFSNPDFRGDRYVIDTDYMPDLANTGFNDRAQSLRVRRGYWIFCSDAQFRGRCRTFGPGDYPRLGWALDNKVSSGRRISERYPYGGQPNWGDRR